MVCTVAGGTSFSYYWIIERINHGRHGAHLRSHLYVWKRALAYAVGRAPEAYYVVAIKQFDRKEAYCAYSISDIYWSEWPGWVGRSVGG